ncbi:MAG: hypothetical protein EXS10_08340 [Phycisphaerales bacterium]|nr:hypothetical protein [Phycisphaerales bacterium]
MERTTSSAPSTTHQTRVLALLIASLALLAFLPSAWLCGWIWDDDLYVTANSVVQSADGLFRAWIPGATPQYYPLVFASFWFEHTLVGLDATLYHIDNALLHAASCVFVFFVLQRIRVPYAFWIAALVAVHPMQAESVAWVTERKNVLSLFFATLSVLAWLRSATQDTHAARSKWYTLALLLFIAAMLSKTTAVFVPPVLILIALWERRVVDRAFIMRVAPFFALGMIGGLHTAYLEKTHVGAIGSEFTLTLLQRMELIAMNFSFYPLHALVPLEQVFIMPRWSIGGAQDAIGVGGWCAMGASIAVVLITVRCWKRNRAPLLLALWYAAAIFPALGFFDVYPFRYSFVADHFAYAAMPAIACVFVLVLARVLNAARLRNALLGVICLAMLVQTWRSLDRFRDEQTLWVITAEQNPSAWIAHDNLAAFALRQAEEAMTLKRTNADIDPTEVDAFVKTCATEALTRSDRALETSINPLGAVTNRAEALRLLGRLEESLVATDRTVELSRGASEQRWLRARVLELLHRDSEARDEFLLAAKAMDGVFRVESLRSLMRLAARNEHVADALSAARELVDAAPDDRIARVDLGSLLLASGAHSEGRRLLIVQLTSRQLSSEMWVAAAVRYVRSVQQDSAADADEISSAHRFADTLVERSGGDVFAKLLLAHMRLRTGDREGARALVGEVETSQAPEAAREEAKAIRAALD